MYLAYSDRWMTFKALLKKLQKKHYPSVRAFAQALGIDDPSRLSRGNPFDVYWCLRLAQVTGENPSFILRTANKGEIATLIENLYGAGKLLLTPEQQALLDAFDVIANPRARQALITIAQEAASQAGGSGQSGTGTPSEPGMPPPPPDKEPYKMAHVFPRRSRIR